MVRECTEGNTVNRNLFRGVTAALLSGSLLTTGAVAGTAMANGAASSPDDRVIAAAPGLDYSVNDKFVPQHPALHRVRARPKRRVAHRSLHRSALVGSPRTIAHALLLRRGWSETQWGCLDELWTRESGWSTYAANRSGAYGIPQALPGYKMSMMGSDWRTNPITQIRWGLYYIGAAYGSPCIALQHSNNYGYY